MGLKNLNLVINKLKLKVMKEETKKLLIEMLDEQISNMIESENKDIILYNKYIAAKRDICNNKLS